jgi:hypothetical protein
MAAQPRMNHELQANKQRDWGAKRELVFGSPSPGTLMNITYRRLFQGPVVEWLGVRF